MRERTGEILKIACYVFAALLLYQLVQAARHINPLARVEIPALPTLASDTNAPATGGKGTNSGSAMSKGTNTSPNVSGTNSGAVKTMKEAGTNFAVGVSTNLTATNIVGPLTPALSPSAGARENGSPSTNELHATTNSAVLTAASATQVPTTNAATLAASAVNPTNLSASPALSVMPISVAGESATNPVASVEGTNAFSGAPASGPARFVTNVSVLAGSETDAPNPGGTNISISKTNSASKKKSKGTNSPAPSAMAMAGMNPGSMRGRKPAELPPEIKARVDRIYESEIFGMVMRPQPMALQGIAGNSAFLRSPSGQTGLVKEGDSLGELKLLKIGINRVLVEQDGKKSELTIFDGYGSESLMPKDSETATNKVISK